MERRLDGKTIAILVADGFEQVELTEPKQALEAAGARTEIVSINDDEVQGWNHDEKGDKFPVDVIIADANVDDYDGLMLPGGVRNPDLLRVDATAVQFVRGFFDVQKPVAAICHGPWTLIEADAVRGKQITSWPSLKTDLRNAGAEWVDKEVVTSNGLVTSRKPQDIPAFSEKMIEEFSEGKHLGQKAGRRK